MRFQTALSNSLIPNPSLDKTSLAQVLAVMQGNDVKLTWTRSTPAREWRVFRIDASLGTPATLIAVLPAEARSYIDSATATKNRYHAWHAHTYKVFAAL